MQVLFDVQRKIKQQLYTANNFKPGVENATEKNWPLLWHVYSEIKAFSCSEDTSDLCRLELSLRHCQNIVLTVRKPSWRSLPAASKMVVLAQSRAALIGPSLAIHQTLNSLSLSLPVSSLIIRKIKMKLSSEVTLLRPFKGQSLSLYVTEWMNQWVGGTQSHISIKAVGTFLHTWHFWDLTNVTRGEKSYKKLVWV